MHIKRYNIWIDRQVVVLGIHVVLSNSLNNNTSTEYNILPRTQKLNKSKGGYQPSGDEDQDIYINITTTTTTQDRMMIMI